VKRFWSSRVVSFVVLIAMVLTLVTACAGGAGEEAAAQKSQVDQILERGVLKVGNDFFVPWVFRDKDGNLAGFEVDVATKLAEDMGVDIEFVPTEWSGIIPALQTGKFDVIIGGMGITTERSLVVNFSLPYQYFGNDLVVSKKMLPGVTSLEELNNENVVVAVRLGATPAATATRLLPKAQQHLFDTDEAVIQDVLNGNAHAAISSSPTPAFWAADYPDVLYQPLGGKLLTSEPCAFAVKKGDHDTLAFFNSWIIDNEDWLQERGAYWFGSKDWEPLLGE
jgi:polar amino acid transport system substrate-binding protein